MDIGAGDGFGFGFAKSVDVSIAYMARTRDYYAALGYPMPYRWAHYATVPFQPLSKPLSACRIALITTAAPFQPDKGDQGARAPYNGAAKFFSVYSGDARAYPDLRISHVAIDRKHTTAEDQNAYFPQVALRYAASDGHIGGLTARFHGLPTQRSQRATLDVDCPELVARCLEDKADAAILVPNCPVCHQSTALAARALESAGIATVIMGCAKDIVEHVGVPRFLFSDFPLGNSAGRPLDAASQSFTAALALRMLESAPASRTTVQSPLRWSNDPDWKLDYCNTEQLSEDELNRLREEFDAAKVAAERTRETGSGVPQAASGPPRRKSDRIPAATKDYPLAGTAQPPLPGLERGKE